MITRCGPLSAAAFWRQAAAVSGPQRVITRPTWVLKPDYRDMQRYYPGRAVRMRQGGEVRMVCSVTVEGGLTACSIDSETPADFGFGAAALKLAPLFRMQPATVNGQTVGGASIIIPIRFEPQN